LSVAKRNYYPLATVANKKTCLPLTQLLSYFCNTNGPLCIFR